jgi:hypothetical protein
MGVGRLTDQSEGKVERLIDQGKGIMSLLLCAVASVIQFPRGYC